jgi:hypothetical protein
VPVARRALGPAALMAALFAVALLVYLAVGAIVLRRLALTGDEPWYVAQGYALLHYGSPNLAPIIHDPRLNQLLLHNVGAITAHVRDYRGNGALLLPNLPGYGAIVGVFYLLAGRWGIVALQAVLSALAVVLIFAEARRVYSSRAAGLFAALAFLTALPAMLYTAQIFPSAIAAFLTFAGFVLVGRVPTLLAGGSPRRLGLAVAALAATVALLPWLHFKYALVSVALVGLLLLRLLPWLRARERGVRAAWYIAGSAAGAAGATFALIALYCHHFFGTWLPQYSAATGGATDLAHPDFARGFALLTDIFLSQQSGLLPWVPLTLLAIPGVVLLWRRSASRAFDLVICVVAQLAGFASVLFTPAIYQGYALPARFTVECVPFVAFAAGGAFAAGAPALRRWWARARARIQPRPLPTAAAPRAASAPDRASFRISIRRALGPLSVSAALLSLLAGSWFSAVALRTPELLYNNEGGNRIVEKDSRFMPGAWFALFPDPEQTNPYLVSAPFDRAYPSAVAPNFSTMSVFGQNPLFMPPGSYRAEFSFTCAANPTAAPGPLAPIILNVEQVTDNQQVAIARAQVAPAQCVAGGPTVRVALRFHSDGFEPIDFRVDFPSALTLSNARVSSAPSATAP